MKKTMKLASRGKRFLAALIDAALPVAAYIIMMSVMTPLGNNSRLYGYGYGDPFDYDYGYNYNYTVPSRTAGMLVGFLGFALLAYIIVELIFYSKAKSIGKAILGLQVVSSVDGKPFGFWKMVLRECVVKGASSSVFGLGYIWILIDERNRAWHDKILDSYVVDLKETEMMYKRAADAARAEVMPVAKPAPKEEAMALPVAKPAEAPKEETKPMPEVRPFDAPDEEVKTAEATNEETPVQVHTDMQMAEAPEEESAEIQPEDAKPAEAPIEEAEPAEVPAEESNAAPAPVNASMAMSRSELLELAARLGVDVSSGATKPELVEEINKAAGGSR